MNEPTQAGDWSIVSIQLVYKQPGRIEQCIELYRLPCDCIVIGSGFDTLTHATCSDERLLAGGFWRNHFGTNKASFKFS